MVIGLAGRMGSGKDTVCELMQELHGGEVLRRAFADPLKISAARALGFVGSEQAAVDYCNMLKEQGTIAVFQGDDALTDITGRQFLQWYGTEAHRNVFGQDFWIDASLPLFRTEADFFGTDPKEDIVVFTDVRFPNEAARIKEWGGEVWEVIRFNDEADEHLSEQKLPARLVNATIDNRGTYDDLRAVVAASLTVLRARQDRIAVERIR